jgi:hypothetical protein
LNCAKGVKQATLGDGWSCIFLKSAIDNLFTSPSRQHPASISIMASITAPQHDVFNGSSSNANIFPNDFTSSNEVDRHTRLAAEAKAEQEKTEKEKKELDDLRTLRIALEKEKAELVGEKKDIMRDKWIIQDERNVLKDQMKALMSPPDHQRRHYSLDPACHGRPAQVVLLANNKWALTCAKGTY